MRNLYITIYLLVAAILISLFFSLLNPKKFGLQLYQNNTKQKNLLKDTISQQLKNNAKNDAIEITQTNTSDSIVKKSEIESTKTETLKKEQRTKKIPKKLIKNSTPKKTQKNNNTVKYSIQLLSRYSRLNHNIFVVENVHEYKSSKDNHYKYCVGLYSSSNQARKKLDQIKKVGYEDAFIIRLTKNYIKTDNAVLK